MGATPKQRISSKHRHDRRSHNHIKPLHLVDCPQCHNPACLTTSAPSAVHTVAARFYRSRPKTPLKAKFGAYRT